MVMVVTTEETWKKLMEGMRRGDIGAFIQQNTTELDDSIRNYLSSGVVVMSMRVSNSVTSHNTTSHTKTFQANQDLIDMTNYIYVPTQAQIDQWDNDDLESIEEMIKIDSGYNS